MFYSHEVLTSRKHGVATIWLVATLGSKSALKRVNRKQILNVDVPKACETLITPEAPMALRLTSNLLYGVSRVYQQQCGYVLLDAQTVQTNMRGLLRLIRRVDLDTEAGSSHPESLLLQDDPTYMPELAFANLDNDIDLVDARIASSSQASVLLSPHTSQASLLSRHDSLQIGGFIIPTSDTGGIGGPGVYQVGSDRGSRHGTTEQFTEGNDDLLPEADFTFDAEGNLIEFDDPATLGGPVQPPHLSSLQGSGGRAPAKLLVGQLPDFESGELEFPAEGRSMESTEQDARGHGVSSYQDGTTPTIIAPQHRKKRSRILQLDNDIALRNRDLQDWNDHYLENMAETARAKMHNRAPLVAKRNAEHWVLGVGLGEVGKPIGQSEIKSPLADLFSGANLYRVLTGRDLHSTGQKRTHDETTPDDEGVVRRVRARSKELARGEELGQGGNGQVDPQDYMDLEVAREAAEPLDDFSSMPWNILASVRGSSVSHGRSGSMLGSAGRPSSFVGPFGLPGGPPTSRRASRMTSASPLAGRAPLLSFSGDEIQSGTSGLGDDGLTMAPDFGDGDDFELYGPAAGVDTQTAGESQWQREVLDAESDNFLDFIQDAIKKGVKASEGDVREVTFKELLNPETNSRVVAAQAILHVLSLGTKNLLKVTQEEAYGDVAISLMKSVEV